MAKIELEPTTTIWALALLLKRLAEAIEWVSQQHGKIKLEVDDPTKKAPTPGHGPVSSGCDRCGVYIQPEEIYRAVRKVMPPKRKPHPKAKRNPKT